MTIKPEFKFNPNASYKSGASYSLKKINLVKQDIYVNRYKSFPVSFPDIFQNYQNPTLHANAPWNTWKNSSFDWWQCQLNFAVWCATAGCGVSYEEHLEGTSTLTNTVYIFHVYYCTSRIIKELQSPIPTDASFCYYKNQYDKAAYQKLCTEFNVSPNTDWRQKLEYGCQGLGQWSTYFKPDGTYRHQHEDKGPFFSPLDAITHGRDISNAWTTFILDKSNGFTHAGLVRINESIRIFVLSLLGAQSQTRVEILKVGTGFDAQKQFLVNIQKTIKSPLDLSTQISKYENVLKYAKSKVDYSYGLGLYMSPSDMVIQIGTVVGYNNEIVIATENQTLGFNSDVNIKPVAPTTQPTTIQGTPTKKSLPEPKIKKSIPEPQTKDHQTKDHQTKDHQTKDQQIKDQTAKIKDQPIVIYTNEAKQHEDNKTALIVGSILIGIVVLTFFKN